MEARFPMECWRSRRRNGNIMNRQTLAGEVLLLAG
jgi:hypothetical protein